MIKLLYPIFFVLILVFGSFSSCAQSAKPEPIVKTGAQILLENHLPELEGKRVGLAMNPTAVIHGVHMLDTLLNSGVNIKALFAAEHGFRGDQADGEVIENGVDRATGLPVFSLYSGSKRPTQEMLSNVDIIIFDMQDVGGRFYTYYQTLFNIIEEASKAGVDVWILDRPNPAGGDYVQGWILDSEYSSFIGKHPIPMAHGMTIAELAKMAIGEKWIDGGESSRINVISMTGWERSMRWNETGFEWIAPSPNLPTFDHALIYLGTVLFEGASVSEGRGTDNPFLTLGSPTIEHNMSELDEIAEKYSVKIDTLLITPKSIQGKASNPKFENTRIKAIEISEIGYDNIDPVQLGLDLLLYFESNDKGFAMREYLNLLAGVDLIGMINSGYVDFVDASEIEDFKNRRMEYLLYK